MANEETTQEERDILQETIDKVADDVVARLKKAGARGRVSVETVSNYEPAKDLLIEVLKARGLEVEVCDDDGSITVRLVDGDSEEDGSDDDVSGKTLMDECMMIVTASEAKIDDCIDAINHLHNSKNDLDIDNARKRIAYNEIKLLAQEIVLAVEWINEALSQRNMIKHIEEEMRGSCEEDAQE